MSLEKFNKSNAGSLKELFSKCCGAENWVDQMLSSAPFESKEEIMDNAQKIWYSLNTEDWLEAFKHHPKIGDVNSLKEKFSNTKQIAVNEQAGVKEASMEVLSELAKLNEDYEKKFGYIFIVCASGKSADEMLSIIKERIENDTGTEIKIAMEEQNKITKLRLEKLL